MPCQMFSEVAAHSEMARHGALVRGVAKPRGLHGEDVPNERMENTRSILFRGIVLILAYYT